MRDEQGTFLLVSMSTDVLSRASALPTEPEDGLLESVKQLRSVVSDLAMLSCRIQDLEQSKFKALQTEM